MGTLGILLGVGLCARQAVAAPRSPDVAAALAPPVQSLTLALSSGVVDLFDNHTLSFKTPDTIPVTGSFRVTLPVGFDVSLALVAYSDSPRPDLPGISGWSSDFQTLNIHFDSTGQPASPGTTMRLVLSDVFNSTEAGPFTVALEVLDGSTTLYGPTLSEPATLSPSDPTQLVLQAPPTDSLAAGESLEFSSIATDVHGNLHDPATVSYRIEPDSLGSFLGSVLTARRPGVGRVIAELSPLSDTVLFRVTSGPLDRWELSGLPTGNTAGAPLAGSVVATARDAFGNRHVYTGALYFATGDPQATLPATASSPYIVQSTDSGRVSFPGTGFIWRRAGLDSLRVTGGGVTGSAGISISSAPAFDFDLSAPDTVTSGSAFALSAVNVTDRYGNPAQGVVTVFTSQSDSTAPNGQVPSLPAIAVTSGQGTSSVVLYKAGEYPVFGRVGDSVRNTPTLVIRPAGVQSFTWVTRTPVVAALPVDSPFSVTALDPYRNLITRYAQVGAPVTLSTTAGDSVSPRQLLPGDFQNGTANLHARGFTYFGPGGSVRFTAQAGTAFGTSLPVEAQAFFAESLSVPLAVLRRGIDTLKGQIRLRLTGAGAAVITGVEFITDQGTFAVTDASPALPAHLTGPTVVSLEARWPLSAGLAEGTLNVTCRVHAQYPSGSVAQLCPDTVAVSVVSASAPQIVSVLPALVAYDDARYLATVTNLGGSGVSFQLDSSRLVLAGGLRRDTARSVQPGVAYLGPQDTLRLEYQVRHAAPFVGDTARPQWHVTGTELGRGVSHSVTGPARVNFTASASLQYLTPSLSPDTLVSGVADTVRVRVRNTGGVAVAQAGALVELLGARDTIRATVTRGLTPFATWQPGDTTLAFALSQAQFQVDTGWYRARLQISGQHNRIDTVFATGVLDSLRVVSPPTLLLDSVWNDAPRRTRVSTGQTWTLTARITNTGGDVIDSVRLALLSDGLSTFADTVTAPTTLFIGQTRELTWNVTADQEPNAQEVFRVELASGLGRVTRQLAVLGGSPYDFLAVQTQEASDLQVEARLFSPADALDGRIAAGSPFEVAGRFVNRGEASTSGARLRIVTTGGVQVTGPIDTISPPVDVDAIWSLVAPDADTTALIIVRFDTLVQDLNTGLAATVSQNADTIPIRIVFEATPLRILNVVTAGGAVDAPYVPMAWDWANEDPTGLFPILVRTLAVEAEGANGLPIPDVASLVTSAHLEYGADTIPAVLTGSQLRFGTDSLARVAPGSSTSVRLQIVPRLSGLLAEFRFVTRASLWSTVERSVGGASLAVPVLDERGANLYIESDLAFVPGSTAANYPNPFRAGSEVTYIQYDLSAPSDVHLDVYTVAGEKVWTFEARSGAAGGRAGPNTVDWNGRNAKGDVVMDGVYIARLRSADGESNIKIVVMK